MTKRKFWSYQTYDIKNKDIVDEIFSLKDISGKKIISSIQKDIIWLIARCNPENGNFMRINSMKFALEKIGVEISEKTIYRHLKYLKYIGIIEECLNDNGISCIRRIKCPDKDRIISLKEYRKKMTKLKSNYDDYRPENNPIFKKNNIHNCAKMTKDELESGEPMGNISSHDISDDSLIFWKSMDKLSQTNGQIVPNQWTNCPTVYNNNENNEKDKKAPPYIPPSRFQDNDFQPDFQSDAMHPIVRGETARHALSEGTSPRETTSINLSEKKTSEKIEEPIIIKKGDKRKNLRERRMEAIELISKGHLVNPLGKPNTKGRLLRPERSKPIPDTGPITISQLWGKFSKLFEESFGIADLLASIMSPTRENVSRYFDEMKQRFLDTTGFMPENRDLYEYVVWFYDPNRLQGLLSANKKTGNKEHIHPNQLLGLVHIRRFYDQRLYTKHNSGSIFSSERISQSIGREKIIQEIYDILRQSEGKDKETIINLVNYGYLVFSEWLHDYKGFDQSKCKKTIIDMMINFVKHSENKDATIDFLSDTWNATVANEKLFKSSLYIDWKETFKDVLEQVKFSAS